MLHLQSKKRIYISRINIYTRNKRGSCTQISQGPLTFSGYVNGWYLVLSKPSYFTSIPVERISRENPTFCPGPRTLWFLASQRNKKKRPNLNISTKFDKIYTAEIWYTGTYIHIIHQYDSIPYIMCTWLLIIIYDVCMWTYRTEY